MEGSGPILNADTRINAGGPFSESMLIHAQRHVYRTFKLKHLIKMFSDGPLNLHMESPNASMTATIKAEDIASEINSMIRAIHKIEHEHFVKAEND